MTASLKYGKCPHCNAKLNTKALELDVCRYCGKQIHTWGVDGVRDDGQSKLF